MKKVINFLKENKAYIAFGLCLLVTFSSGYLLNKNNLEKESAENETSKTQAFITEGERVMPEIKKGESITVMPEERVLPEAFPNSKYAEEPLPSVEALDAAKKETFSLKMPINAPISKPYSKAPVYSVTMDDWRSHEGIDILADVGDEVLSAEKGTVSSVGKDPSLGVYIRVRHENGFESMYANLHGEITVTEGQNIEKGHIIGYVGSTSLSEGAQESHLHFELTKDSKRVNPSDYIRSN